MGESREDVFASIFESEEARVRSVALDERLQICSSIGKTVGDLIDQREGLRTVLGALILHFGAVDFPETVLEELGDGSTFDLVVRRAGGKISLGLQKKRTGPSHQAGPRR